MTDVSRDAADGAAAARLASMAPATVQRWLARPPVADPHGTVPPRERPAGGDQGTEARTVDSRVVDGTVLSADISGFTRLAERLAADGVRQAAESLITAINRCFEPMIDEVRRRGGDVLKFGGDAIFVLFEGPDHPAQAAKAASHLQQSIGLVDLGVDLTLSMTVGVATGQIPLVLAGVDRRELVVQGPVVDECLRLEAEAEPGEVLISTETASRIPEEWLTEPEPGVIALADLTRVPLDEPAVLHNALDPADGPDPAVIDWPTVIGGDLAEAIEAFDRTVGEIRVVTVAFVMLPTSDLSDAQMSRVVERAIELCARYGVTMLSTDVAVGGIKILLAAGAPTAGEGDEDALLATLADLVLDPDAVPMRAGVNRGLVFAGFLGSSACRTFTVMGDPTNLAARLLGKADDGAVAVSQAVLDHSRVRYPTVELPPVMVKGRVQPVTVHQLQGPATAMRDTNVNPELVGREAELATIADAWAAARNSPGVLLDVRAGPGLGASRLLAHFVSGLSGAVPRFHVQGLVHTVGNPYHAVTGFLRSVAGIDDDAGRTEAGLQLADWVARVAPDVTELLPLIAPAFGATVGEPDAETGKRIADIEPEFRQAVANGAIVRLPGASLTIPTAVVVEGRQWLDPASADLLTAFAAELPDRPWLVLSAGRPDGETWDVDPSVVSRIDLQPLTPEATKALIASVSDLPGPLLAEVATTSGGNPLFALELARSLSQDDDPTATGGGFRRTLPDSVESLITAQIDRLGHRNRELVRTAAVLGSSFPVDLLAELLGRDAREELPGVAKLIDVRDGTGVFRSEVVARVAYDGLSGHRRVELHGAVAAVLEEHRADISQLAWHNARAGHHDRAWRYSHLAAERAAELGLLGQAADHLGQAIQAADAGGQEVATTNQVTDALTTACLHCIAAKRYDEASAYGERALDRITDRLDRVRLLIRLATVDGEVAGSYQGQVVRLTEELAACTAPDDAESRAWLHATLAGFHYRLDNMDQALGAVDAAVSDAGLAGVRGPLVPALRIRQVVLAGRADPARLEVGRELIRLATELEDHRALHSVHNNLGLDLMEDGQWDEAVEHFDRAVEQAVRIGDEHGALLPAVNRASIAINRGQWDLARTELHELRREATHYGSGFVASFVQAEVGRLEVNAGRPGEAIEPLETALDWFRESQVASNEYEVRLSLAAADIAAGQGAAGLANLRDLEAPQDLVAQQLGRKLILTGYANMQLGNPEEALDALTEALAETEGRNRLGTAEAHIGLAEAEQFLGRARAARRNRAAGEEILAELGVEHLPVIPLPK
ncbi:MAG: adenylate/guanylate cyclase domain-containing protein [Actinomycetota bacterium]